LWQNNKEMMLKNYIITGLALMTLSLNAQELPKVSSNASVEQVVGVTHINIKYSRPSVKERDIFGGLVPYNEVWRLGANEPTQITTDQVLTFGKQVLKPGTYAIFAIPGEDTWKVVFNTDYEQWGAGNYDESKNVVSVKVEIKEVENVENLTIQLDNVTEAGGELCIEWANVKVSVPFATDTKKNAEKNIEDAIAKGEDVHLVYNKAASYYRDQKELKTALKYVDLSIKAKEFYGNNFMKAKILADLGENDEAVKFGKKAVVLAKEANMERYVIYYQKNVDKWSK
jgi:tetratricopeptide (TPR) repeat protein